MENVIQYPQLHSVLFYVNNSVKSQLMKPFVFEHIAHQGKILLKKCIFLE